MDSSDYSGVMLNNFGGVSALYPAGLPNSIAVLQEGLARVAEVNLNAMHEGLAAAVPQELVEAGRIAIASPATQMALAMQSNAMLAIQPAINAIPANLASAIPSGLGSISSEASPAGVLPMSVMSPNINAMHAGLNAAVAPGTGFIQDPISQMLESAGPWLSFACPSAWEERAIARQAMAQRALLAHFDRCPRPMMWLGKSEVRGGKEWIVGAYQRAGWDVLHPFDDSVLFEKRSTVTAKRESLDSRSACQRRARAPSDSHGTARCTRTRLRQVILRRIERRGTGDRWLNSFRACFRRLWAGCTIPRLFSLGSRCWQALPTQFAYC